MMESPKINIAVDQLSFSLFQRPLHPELFQIYANRKLKTEKYQANIWVTGCTHVVTVHTKEMSLAEVVSAPNQPLPQRGLIERFQFRGPRSHKCSLSKKLHYMTDFQVEKMSRNLYRQSHLDLDRFAKNRGIFVKYQKVENDGLHPFCYVDYEARQDELHIHTFAAYPEQLTMVKTQSLFSFQ
ncbi:MAG: DUF2617 family protein [Planctomycetes bacterium]|nr:DUF2617 family protein [Planctomycetota bacterium]